MQILTIFQILIALLLVVTIILQSRGDHKGAAFGTATQTYRSRKGVEQLLFYSTIALAALFASVSILAVLI